MADTAELVHEPPDGEDWWLRLFGDLDEGEE